MITMTKMISPSCPSAAAFSSSSSSSSSSSPSSSSETGFPTKKIQKKLCNPLFWTLAQLVSINSLNPICLIVIPNFSFLLLGRFFQLSCLSCSSLSLSLSLSLFPSLSLSFFPSFSLSLSLSHYMSCFVSICDSILNYIE